MLDKYNFDIKARDASYKETIYNVMVATSKKYPPENNLSRRDMNNLFLNASRDHYLRTYEIEKPRTRLKSDVALFEGRKSLPPMARALPQQQTMPSLQMPMPVAANVPVPAPGGKGVDEPYKETAYDPNEFDRKLVALRGMRQDPVAAAGDEPVAASATPENPMQLKMSPIASTSPTTLDRVQFVAPPAAATYVSERYIIVNGFDRDWSIHKSRFRVVADFGAVAGNSMQQRFKNIRSISIKRVIIPQEICDAPSLGNPTKNQYNHSFSFSMSYVLIAIDEIQGAIDGTNDTARRSFCQMLPDKCYKAPNGRGYLVLQSMQDEKRIFYPTPLSSLNRLTITVRKPNGDIFNMSQDDYVLARIQRDGLNPSYMMLELSAYFDRNEFWKGDSILIRNFEMEGGVGGGGAGRRLADFMNRSNGHVIAELGQPNPSGYFKSLYIRAPGTFDSERGIDTVDDEIMRLIDADDGGAVSGCIMNSTLQITVSFKVETISADLTPELANVDLVTA
jgi:hypothetical protein